MLQIRHMIYPNQKKCLPRYGGKIKTVWPVSALFQRNPQNPCGMEPALSRSCIIRRHKKLNFPQANAICSNIS
jgi:hypothetical protein